MRLFLYECVDLALLRLYKWLLFFSRYMSATLHVCVVLYNALRLRPIEPYRKNGRNVL